MATKSTTVIIVFDGLDEEYLDACETPNMQELWQKGFRTSGRSMPPTVTNVNNVSLVTNSYPDVHGICSNFRLVLETGEEIYMESGEFIMAETMFQRATAQGKKSLLVTSKDKLRKLLADGATITISSESPPEQLVKDMGAPPKIYSLEVNGWVIDAANHIMTRHEDLDVVYITTTDYAMHTYAPEHPESQRHMTILDEAVGRLVERHPDITLLITADHGMSAKSRMIHLPGILAQAGIQARAIPVIKDQYTLHHSNLGGCIYVHLENARDLECALETLRNIDGVDDALPREEAAREYHLMPDRIGDIMVLGATDVVFGDPTEVTFPEGLRSHGSLHEQRVPIIGCGDSFDGFEFLENKDLGRYVFERVLA